MSEVPKKFRRGDMAHKCVFKTVGELKELLAELPDDLPFQQAFADEVQTLRVVNHGDDTVHCAIWH